MMLALAKDNRAYNPETVAAMTAAFEQAGQTLSMRSKDNDDADYARRTLALKILQHVDKGERDPKRLANLAVRELASVGHRTTGRR